MGRPHTIEIEKKFKKKLDNRIQPCYNDNMKQNTETRTLESKDARSPMISRQ